MATVTGLTKARMEQIEAQCIIDGAVVLGDLILTRNDGSSFNAGRVLGEKGDAANQSIAPDEMTVPLRAYGGRVKTGTPIDPDDAVPKSVVDSLHAVVELPGGVDLNTITTNGLYSQTLTAEAASGTNYPQAIAGLLQVFAETSSGNMVWQRFTPYGTNATVMWQRARYNNVWYPWAKVNFADTDWVSTGLVIGSSASFTITSYALRKFGPRLSGYINATYTGAAITTGTDANMTDMNSALVMPSGWRNTSPVATHFPVVRGGTQLFWGRANSNGSSAIDLVFGAFDGQVLATSTPLTFYLDYFID